MSVDKNALEKRARDTSRCNSLMYDIKRKERVLSRYRSKNLARNIGIFRRFENVLWHSFEKEIENEKKDLFEKELKHLYL